MARSVLDGISTQDTARLAAMARRQLAVQHQARQLLLDHVNELHAAEDSQGPPSGPERAMVIALRDLAQGLLDNAVQAVEKRPAEEGEASYHFRF
ncbi:hypothetical protein PT931_19910 [Longispora urticae]